VTRRLFSKALVFAAFAATAWAGPSARAQQGDGGPTLIFTAKSAGELVGDLRYLASSLTKPGDPQAAQILGVLDGLKDPKAFQGLDPSKPLGAFATIPAEAGAPPSAVIFLPVLDGKMLLDALGGIGATVEVSKDTPGFTHTVMLPNVPMPLFVTQANGYLYLSMASTGADALKALKPASLLPKRAGAGDLSLTVRLDRLPPMYKQQFNDALEQNLAGQREKKAEETDIEYQGRMTGMKMSQDAFVAFVRDGKELSLDLVIDPKKEFVGVELNSSAVPASAYATSLRKIGAMKSKFRGMTSDAAVGGYVAIPVPQGLRDLMGKAFDDGLAKAKADPKTDAAAKKLAEEVAPAFRDTITAESIDIAAAIQGPTTGSTPSYAAVLAMAVKGGAKFDKAIREAAKTMPADKKKDFKLDFAKAADGTPIHKLANLSDDPGPFGEATIYTAFRNDVAVIGIGKTGQAALNAALVGSKTLAASAPAPQVEIFVAASRVGSMGKEAKERDAMKAAAAEVFTGTAAKKDKVSLVLRAEGDAMSLRIGADVPAIKFLTRVSEIMRN
jgi:hypothetical protein